MGVDLFKASDFVDSKCLYSLNERVLLEHYDNPNYQNPLKNNVVEYRVYDPSTVHVSNISYGQPVLH
jgi:hypothetical protein